MSAKMMANKLSFVLTPPSCWGLLERFPLPIKRPRSKPKPSSGRGVLGAH